MYRLSVLDLAPVPSGSTSAEALRNTLDLARLADALGYERYWLAEHHNTALIASSAPEVLIGQVAAVTRGMRVGSGGVMLPNHAPLKVAETFRTLLALHGPRIDLGLGRAPGTDSRTALALRRSRAAFFAGDFPEDHPFRGVRAVPEDAGTPDVWLLGSSDFSARLAARLGLGFAFAHHINPLPAVDALRLYRAEFRPSSYLSEPRSLVAVSAVCAETDERADVLARSADLTWLRFAQGRLGHLPSVEEATSYPYTPEERAVVRMNRQRTFVGSPASVRERLTLLAGEAGAGEIMVTTMTHDHAARRRSYELLAGAFAVAPRAA